MARPKGKGRGRKLPDFLKRREWDAVIAAGAVDRRYQCTALRDKAIIALFLGSGLRCAELTSLVVGDVDFDEGTVHVRHGKGDKERYSAVSDEALHLVEAYLDTRPELRSEDPLFLSMHRPQLPLFVSRNGGSLSTRQLRYLTKQAGEKAGQGSRVHPHLFRHSHATRMRDKGASLEDIGDQLGHEDLDTTRIYAHTSVRRRRDAVGDL